MPRQTLSALIAVFISVCVPLAGCGGGSGTPKVAQVVVTSNQSSIAVSANDGFSATAQDRHGNPIAGIVFTWSSSANSIASINGGGLAKGLLPGTTQITAAADGVTSAPMTLTVTPGFLPTGNLNTPRLGATATVLNNGKVLIAGGNNSGVDINNLTSAEIYDPATGTFTATGSLNEARYLHTATLLNNGMVLIAGGVGPLAQPLASAELYNPATGMFTETGAMNVGRYPSTGTFSVVGSLATGRESHTATLLPNGTVLIVGGIDAGGSLASAELYNVVTKTFTPAGNLATSRFFHTATLLATGNVLIAGGINTASGALSSTEIYNPAAGTITPGGNMATAREAHAATLMDNGQVLITGGAAATVLNTSELY